MTLSTNQLTKDISQIDSDDILSCWRWKVKDVDTVVVVSLLGDIFLQGKDGSIHWLRTDTAELIRIADNKDSFKVQLNDSEKLNEWLMPALIEQLIDTGKILKDNEVYSYEQSPMIGGNYSIDNLKPLDISVHFAFSGQIAEQIKDLPEGTKVKINYKP